MKDTEKIVTALHLAPQLHIDKLADEIFVLRQQTINTAIIQQLQDLMHEKGITELYAIDESKVMQLIKEHNALEIIKNKGVDVSAVIQIAKSGKSYITYNNHLEKYKGVGDLVNQHRKPLIKEEYELLKEVLYEKED